ncbi:MAG: hypothetical protein WBB22_02275 [Anaerolineae bacterium]
MADRLTSLVRWFSPRRGYGFIQLPEGEDVEFSMKEASKGPQAVDVVRLNIYSPLYEAES